MSKQESKTYLYDEIDYKATVYPKDKIIEVSSIKGSSIVDVDFFKQLVALFRSTPKFMDNFTKEGAIYRILSNAIREDSDKELLVMLKGSIVMKGDELGFFKVYNGGNEISLPVHLAYDIAGDFGHHGLSQSKFTEMRRVIRQPETKEMLISHMFASRLN